MKNIESQIHYNMTTTIVKRPSITQIALIDAAVLGIACLIPTLSHLTALPLYRLNPMMLVLLGGMAAVRDPESGTTLSRKAVLLPVVSMLAVGMPAPAKALCMVAEMLTFVSVATMMERAWHRTAHGRDTAWRCFAAVTGMTLGAMLCGKIVYYGLKALLLPSVALIGTPLLTQAVVMVAAAGLYALLLTRKR